MCGIAGIIDFSSRTQKPEMILDMAKKIRHRGPDGEGVAYFDEKGNHALFHSLECDFNSTSVKAPKAALAHLRLSIIDLSERGAQPMSDVTKKLWITFNGEIYNYIELRASLEKTGHVFLSDTDTEVILHAYREWGIACLDQLNGMFAFAIWDCSKNEIFCARDRLGIKPFYYSYINKRFVFASEEKAILSALETSPSANIAGIYDYLNFSYIPSAATMFADISRLEPGNYMLISSNEFTIRKYWDPSFDPVPSGISFDQRKDELESLIDDSIRLQIRSDVPIGAHLSGGIDSSTVCCYASKHLSELYTFTAKFGEGGFYDESAYARLISEHIGSKSHEIVPSGMKLNELLPKIIYHLDEPVEAASVFGKYHVAEIVSQSVKVVLGGQGGDELFGGYDWYLKNMFTASFFGAKQPMHYSSRGAFIFDMLKHESPKRLAKSLWKNFGDSSVKSIFCNNWARFKDEQLSGLVNPELLKEMNKSSKKRFMDTFESISVKRQEDCMFKFDTQHYLQALLTSEDRLSMAFSIESRVPLLDHRIAELAGKIGYEMKSIPGSSKHLLREAVRKTVPNRILDRTDKRGFPTPIGTWLRDPNMRLLDNFVYSDNKFAKHYFDLDKVREIEKKRTYLSTDSSERLWRIMTVCVWGEVFGVS